MKKVLVVCTGNICRTPMVGALLERELAQAGWQDEVIVDSAGTYAVVGGSASTGSVIAMAERGLDISSHRGKQLDWSLIEEADLILVMEEHQRRSIFTTWPKALRKTFLLSEMAGEHDDIDDPYRLEQAKYDKAARIIEDYVQRGAPRIIELLQLQSEG
jgi:protein-tyrosine phosphatase